MFVGGMALPVCLHLEIVQPQSDSEQVYKVNNIGCTTKRKGKRSATRVRPSRAQFPHLGTIRKPLIQVRYLVSLEY